MLQRIHYCAFYGRETTGVAGQQNLSLPVRDVLDAHFEVVDHSPDVKHVERFPTLMHVLAALHLLLLRRLFASAPRAVTVVDMVHSFTAIPKERRGDRFVLLGHDSYSLRTWRDLRRARGAGRRLRLALSWLGWSYVELLARRVAWHALFVSPLDLDHAGRRRHSSLLAIPLGLGIRALGKSLRAAPQGTPAAEPRDRPRILVATAVVNPSQNAIDARLVQRTLEVAGGRADVTLWGRGAPTVARGLPSTDGVVVVEWVDDYAAFLRQFDVLVYPRSVGSGFHTKVAEALAMGIPCVCEEWIAFALRAAGYDGMRSFTDEAGFSKAVAEAVDRALSEGGASAMPMLPEAAKPDVALRPLVEACRDALGGKMEQS